MPKYRNVPEEWWEWGWGFKQSEGKCHLDEGILISFLGCPRHALDWLHRFHFCQINEAFAVGVLHGVIVPHLTHQQHLTEYHHFTTPLLYHTHQWLQLVSAFLSQYCISLNTINSPHFFHHTTSESTTTIHVTVLHLPNKKTSERIQSWILPNSF